MPENAIYNYKNKPLLIQQTESDSVDLDVHLSSETKFTVRALLSFCLFILVVFFYEIKFTILGARIDYESSINNFAQLSFWVITVHIVIFLFYFRKDYLLMKNNKLKLTKKIKNLKLTLQSEKEIYKKISTEQTHAQFIKEFNKSTYERTIEWKGKRLSPNPKLIKEVKKELKEYIEYIEEETMLHKAIKKNDNFIIWGLNFVYPMVISVFCAIILFPTAFLGGN